MHCNQYADAIQELADGTLGPVRRAELQTHLDQCDACRALAADLRKIRDAAASLDQPAPPERVWLQIAGRLRQEGRVVDESAPHKRRMALFALAAALVLTVGGSLWLLYPMRQASIGHHRFLDPGSQAAPDAAGNAAGPTPSKVLRTNSPRPSNTSRRVSRSWRPRRKATRRRSTPQPRRRSRRTWSSSIRRSPRAARRCKSEPQSAPARDSLFEALRRKVSLLQDTVALMNEMRKGNSAGAAQIIDANKS